MNELLSYFFLSASLLIAGCSNDLHMPASPQGQDKSLSGALITYEKDIRPLFESHCMICHNASSPTPNWQNYDVVMLKKDSLMKRFVTDKTMPPPPYDKTISEKDRMLVGEWLRNGGLKTDGSSPSPGIPTQGAPAISAETIIANAILTGDIESVKRFGDPNLPVSPQADGNLANWRGYPPLLMAIKQGNPGMTGILLGRGAELNAKLPSGETAQSLAQSLEESPAKALIIDLLKEFGEGGTFASPPNVLSYHRDILPIFQARCMLCHNENIPATNWMKYENAYSERALIYVRTVIRKDMPLGTDAANATQMTDEERKKVARWIQSGSRP